MADDTHRRDPALEKRIDDVIRGSPVSVTIADPSLPGCPLIAVSDNFEEVTGYDRREVLGRNCRFLNQHCEVPTEVRQALHEVVADASGKATFGGKIQNQRKNGSVFVNILRLRSIFLGGRRLLVGIQLDEAVASISEKDVLELENALERRGVLAKWMWSKSPVSSKLDTDDMPSDQLAQRISVVLQPQMLTPEDRVEDSLVVLISYRTNASVITAMGEGAKAANVCQNIGEAKSVAASYRRESRVLCGELNYKRTEGFDYGLSPQDFVGSMAQQPTMVISGTSVPRAIKWAKRAKILVLGSFLNLSALIELIVDQQPTPVILLCAGQDSKSGDDAERHSIEQEAFCGFLLHTLIRTVTQPALLLLNETAKQTMQAIDPDGAWQSTRLQFYGTQRSRDLLAQKQGAETIEFCLQVNRYDRILPWYFPFLGLFIEKKSRTLLGLPGGPLDVLADGPQQQRLEERTPQIITPTRAPETMRLFLVRHGEYEGSVVQGMAGRLDVRLNETGIDAAKSVGDLLAIEPLEIMLCSPLLRCIQTAELIAQPQKHRGLVPEINRRLAAIDRGDWSGLTPQQVQEHFPGDLHAWQKDPDFKDNGGESLNEHISRTRHTLDYVLSLARTRARKTGEPIAACIVGHSSTIASTVMLAMASNSGTEWTAVSKMLAYSSVTLVEFDNVVAGERPRVVYIGKVPQTVRPTRPLSNTGDFAHSSVSLSGSSDASNNAVLSVSGRSVVPPSDSGTSRGFSDVELSTFTKISVVTLPHQVSPDHDVENRIVILIDALRMSSTLVTAMGQGLESAQLLSSVMEVTHAVQGYGPCVLLGGEQKRVLIPGFDRDNSPRSYLDGVTEKKALFLTTNGTRALPWIRRSKMLALGSFLNVSAVIRTILHHLRDASGVVLICSGTERGTVRSHDDELCAGYLLKTLLASHKDPASLDLDDDAVSILQRLHSLHSWEAVRKTFHATPAAEELRKINLEADVEFCIQRDRYRDVLPVYIQGLDVFIPHQVNYNYQVQYEKTYGLTGSALVAAPHQIKMLLIAGDDERDLFQSKLRDEPSRFDLSGAVSSRIQQLERALEGKELSIVACSPNHICRRIAGLVSNGESAEIYAGLSNVKYGDWFGLSAEEVELYYPGSLAKWQVEPDWQEHGGESARQVCKRAGEVLQELIGTYATRGCSGILLVVTHDALVRALVAVAKQIPLDQVSSHWRQEGDSTILMEAVPTVRQGVYSCLPEDCQFQVKSISLIDLQRALNSATSRL